MKDNFMRILKMVILVAIGCAIPFVMPIITAATGLVIAGAVGIISYIITHVFEFLLIYIIYRIWKGGKK